jgi:putative lipoprotein
MAHLRQIGAAFLLVALAAVPALAGDSRISGNIFHRERIALPPGFVVKAQLLDVSRQDAPADEIGSVVLTPDHQVPVAYEIAFDPARIDPAHIYSVRAEIRVDGRLMFASGEHHPVITRGAPLRADILVQRVATPRTEGPAPEIYGDWLVQEIGGRGVAADLRSSLRLDADGQVSGLAGCNRFAGGFDAAQGKFQFQPLASTMMACPEKAQQQEALYYAALSKVRSARVEGGLLILRDAEGAVQVKLARARDTR